MAWEVFHSVHVSARFYGVPCYIKTLRDRSSWEKLGQSETSQGWEKVSPEAWVDWEENRLLYITGTNPMWPHGKVGCNGTQCNIRRWQYQFWFATQDLWCWHEGVEGTSDWACLLGMGRRLGRGITKKNDCVAEAQLLANIKVLSSVIPTQGNHFWFGNKILSSTGGEVMDSSLLVFVLMMKMIMHSHWRLHVNW